MTYIVAAALFFPFLAVAVGVTFVVAFLTRGLGRTAWIALLVVVSSLLVTPTMGPATIAVVPVTFGWLLVPSVATGSWSELVAWLSAYPVWHAFAFPATAAISYLVLRRVRPNNSFKPKPLRGSA
jgi:hypothetical protein